MFDSKDLSLKTMILSALLKWRVIVVVMILFAALLPFVAIKRGGSILPESPKEETESESKTESAEVIAVNISTLADLYRDYADIDKQMRQNEALGLDPEKLKYAYVQYHITPAEDSEEAPDLAALATAYNLYFLGKGFVDDLLSGMNSASDPALYAPFVVANVVNSDLVIKAPCAEDMDPDKLLQTIKSLVDKELRELQVKLAHGLKPVGEGFSEERNATIANERKALVSSKYNTNNSITGITKNMSEEQIQYAKELSEGKITEDEIKALIAAKEDSSNKAKEASGVGVKTIILYAIVGAIIGFAVAIFVLCEMFIFSGKLHTTKELTKNAGLFLFGTVEVPVKRRKGFPDNKIRACLHENRRGYDTDKQISAVSAAVKLFLDKKGINSILMTSSLFGKIDEDITDRLVSAINAQGVDASFVDSVVLNRDALLKCSEVGNIILVEQIGRSVLADIENEITSAKGYGINILGTIVFE